MKTEKWVDYKRAFQIAIVGNILLAGIGLVILSNSSVSAASNLEPLRPANGWILRYANKVLTVEPNDDVLVVCSTGKQPVWNSISRGSEYSVNHTVSCPND